MCSAPSTYLHRHTAQAPPCHLIKLFIFARIHRVDACKHHGHGRDESWQRLRVLTAAHGIAHAALGSLLHVECHVSHLPGIQGIAWLRLWMHRALSASSQGAASVRIGARRECQTAIWTRSLKGFCDEWLVSGLGTQTRRKECRATAWLSTCVACDSS